MVTEDDLTWGDGHTVQYEDHVSQNCALDSYMTLLTNVTPTHLIKNLPNTIKY